MNSGSGEIVRGYTISPEPFCWFIFRLGGTGLGLTEEVEGV